ncbi:hypothetical protein [Sedimenticola sp.]|uniref:hypothetical protein n=1 Tax=Sedimenticola sp. TaxID=1940285 RepID=UPI003D0E2B47
MDSSSIELSGTAIESIRVEDDTITVRFAPAYIIKTLSGSTERTRWRQQGNLVFTGAELEESPEQTPAICVGGDVGQSVYTYRDMLPLPFEGRGRVYCDLRFEGSERHLKVVAEAVKLNMEDRPYYIEHIRSS